MTFPSTASRSLDFAQWPRIPLLDSTYMKKFALHGVDLSTLTCGPPNDCGN